MNDILLLLVGVFLVIHGVFSLHASYKGKKTLHWEMPSTTFLTEKIFKSVQKNSLL